MYSLDVSSMEEFKDDMFKNDMFKDTLIILLMYVWIVIVIFLSIYRHIIKIKKERNRYINYDDIEDEFHKNKVELILKTYNK